MTPLAPQDNQPLLVFLFLRSQLENIVELLALLDELCKAQDPAKRACPGDPFSSLPLRIDLSSPIRPLTRPFEKVDFLKVQQILQDVQHFLSKFSTKY